MAKQHIATTIARIKANDPSLTAVDFSKETLEQYEPKGEEPAPHLSTAEGLRAFMEMVNSQPYGVGVQVTRMELLAPQDFVALADALKGNTHVTSLNLEGHGLSVNNRIMYKFIESVGFQSRIHTLNLKDNNLDYSSVALLINNPRFLRHLDVRNNDISSLLWVANGLVSLDLRGNRISDTDKNLQKTVSDSRINELGINQCYPDMAKDIQKNPYLQKIILRTDQQLAQAANGQIERQAPSALPADVKAALERNTLISQDSYAWSQRVRPLNTQGANHPVEVPTLRDTAAHAVARSGRDTTILPQDLKDRVAIARTTGGYQAAVQAKPAAASPGRF